MSIYACVGAEWDMGSSLTPGWYNAGAGNTYTWVNGGLRNSFGAIQLSGPGIAETDFGLYNAPSNTTPRWINLDFKVTQFAASFDAHWVLYLVGQRAANVKIYALNIKGQASPAGFFLDLYRLERDGSGNETLVALVTGTTLLSVNTVYRLSILLDPVTPFPIQTWINGTQDINYSGSSACTYPTGINYFANYHKVITGGKTPQDLTVITDNVMWDDDSSAAGRLGTEYVVMGHQPNADTTPDNFSVSHGTEKYLAVADMNRTGGTADDYIHTSTVGVEQALCFANMVDSGGTADPKCAALIWRRAAPVGVLSDDGRIAVSDGGPDSFTYDNPTDGGTRLKMMKTAPGGLAWTKARFNSFQATLKRGDYLPGTQMNYTVVSADVAGRFMGKPTASATGTADEPPAAIKRRYAALV